MFNNFEYSKLKKVILVFSISLLIFLFLGFVNKTQDIKDKEVLVKLSQLHQYYLKNPNYSVDVKHILYSSSFSTDVIDESFNGFYKTNGILEHSQLMGILTLQNSNIRMVLDTQSKIITISNPLKKEPFSTESIQYSLKLCKTYTLTKTDSLEQILMEFDPKKNPLEKLIISIKNNRIVKLDMFHTEKIENNKEEQIFPHTRVEFSNYDDNNKLRGKDININEYITQKNNKWVLTDKYKNYQLHDLRTPKK